MFSFKNELFVERPRVEDVWKWIRNPNEKRVLGLIGPPGTGKSWLCAWVAERAKQEYHQCVFFVNACDVTEQAVRQEWERALEECCPGRVAEWRNVHDVSLPLATQWAQLARWLCVQCNVQPPLLILDGYDEVDEKKRMRLSRDVLLPFFQGGCTRLLVPYRAGIRLEHAGLFRFQKYIYVGVVSDEGVTSFAREQLEKLYRNECKDYTLPSNLETWMGQLERYCWDHPGLNNLLFRRATKQGKDCGNAFNKRLDDGDIWEVLKEAVTCPANGDTGSCSLPSAPAWETLWKLANLRTDEGQFVDEWKILDAEAALGHRFNNYPVIDELFASSLLFSIEGKWGFYKVADGFRELLREIRSVHSLASNQGGTR